MSDLIKFSNFTADQVRDQFFLSAHHTVETAAIRYLFAMMQEELNIRTGSKAENNVQVGKATIEKISFRFDLFKEFSGQFFAFDDKPDRLALVLAVICDEYINHAAPPEEDEDFKPEPLHNYLDHAMVRRAVAMWEEAIEIETIGLCDETTYQRESLFLAHINAMEHLRDIELSLDGFDNEELEKTLKDLERITALTDKSTKIGKVLAEFTGIVTAQVKEVLSETPPPAPRPAFRVINGDKPAP